MSLATRRSGPSLGSDAIGVVFHSDSPATLRIAAALRSAGCEYDPRRRVLTARGPREIVWGLDYVGADDAAGPNYTGQPAVDSYYVAR